MKHILIYTIAALCLCTGPFLEAQTPANSSSDPQLQTKALPGSAARRKAQIAAMVDEQEKQIDILVNQYYRSDAEGRPFLRLKVEKALRELFELKLRQREQALRDLQQEIKDVQAGLEQNRRDKDAIVEKRLRELLDKRR